MVVSHIVKRALCNFALVNSDCYRLAHAGRFHRLSFDHTAASEIEALRSWSTPGSLRALRARSPIEHCVRHLDLSDHKHAYDHSQAQHPRLERQQALFDTLSSLIRALVNLEAFSCNYKGSSSRL